MRPAIGTPITYAFETRSPFEVMQVSNTNTGSTVVFTINGQMFTVPRGLSIELRGVPSGPITALNVSTGATVTLPSYTGTDESKVENGLRLSVSRTQPGIVKIVAEAAETPIYISLRNFDVASTVVFAVDGRQFPLNSRETVELVGAPKGPITAQNVATGDTVTLPPFSGKTESQTKGALTLTATQARNGSTVQYTASNP